MAVAYPVGLPSPLVNGSTHEEIDANERNDVRDGPPRIERLTSSPPAVFNVTWRFTADEMDTFDTWWKDTTLRGALNFNMDLFVGNAVRSHELQFNAPYRSRLEGRLWSVTARLIAIDKVYA